MAKTMIDKYNQLKKHSWCGKWGIRILSELQYLIELSKSLDGKYEELLGEKVDELIMFAEENGAITKEICLKLENDMDIMKADAKALTVLLIAHAHIDMNWMWGFNETAALTVSTFETMLQLMREYPQFKFSQSQASVYKIIEDYAPYLLPEIKQRVAEGRWEVTASTWVENDKNMSGTEAMAKHLLYTKKYLAGLLDIDMDSLNIDFEPDTFGHNENMPEILNQGGVKYYYHCRGHYKEHIYRWKAPSGAEVLVYREPVWYNDELSRYDSLGFIPSFCKAHGITKTMKFYGVGDHGGGPTRKEIEHWLEMQEWPLMPTISFGTMKEFFESLEEHREQLPVVEQELNYIFPGCYTTQARVKRANKIGEDRLGEAEIVDAMAKKYAPDYQIASKLEEPWTKILFNQFHDILPGSGVLETYQHALGQFQEAEAAAQIDMNHALKAISEAMDTSVFGEEENKDASLGAGVGFGCGDGCGYMAGFVSQSKGKNRIVTVVNPTRYPRKEAVKIVLWDWEGDVNQLAAWDAKGNEVPLQLLRTKIPYWAHTFHELLIEAEVPAFGYSAYVLREKSRKELDIVWEMFSTTGGNDPRLDEYTDAPIVLENEKVRVVFDAVTMMITSFVNKETGREMLNAPAGVFRMITENPVNDMIAWRVGPYQKVVNLNETENVKVLKQIDGDLEKAIEYEIEFEASKLFTRISLKKGSCILEMNVTVDWHELGNGEKGIPQLNFSVPVGYSVDAYRCGIPGGILDREAYAQDVPCIGFMNAIGQKEDSLCVMSDSKYGFRGWEDAVSVTILRGSYDPDPTPDQGQHYFRLGIGVVTDKADVTEKSETFIHPIYTCSGNIHKGILPVQGSMLAVDGNVKVVTMKCAEDGNGFILRLQNIEKKETTVKITAAAEILRAELVDFQERSVEKVETSGSSIALTLPCASMRTVRIVFA